jgi:hypothetical protein
VVPVLFAGTVLFLPFVLVALFLFALFALIVPLMPVATRPASHRTRPEPILHRRAGQTQPKGQNDASSRDERRPRIAELRRATLLARGP